MRREFMTNLQQCAGGSGRGQDGATLIVEPPRPPPLERNISGFDDYAQIVDVADRLLARGFSEPDVHNILGENFFRVFGQVFG